MFGVLKYLGELFYLSSSSNWDNNTLDGTAGGGDVFIIDGGLLCFLCALVFEVGCVVGGGDEEPCVLMGSFFFVVRGVCGYGDPFSDDFDRGGWGVQIINAESSISNPFSSFKSLLAFKS